MLPCYYRRWAAARLYGLKGWTDLWGMQQIFAGIGSQGAEDAWMNLCVEMESMQLHRTDFCGGAVDIAKCFDQISRHLLYRLAAVAGMPKGILTAYKNFQEDLVVYNTIARGIGKPYSRRCGIPQGDPLSMMMVALMMRPWVSLMLYLGLSPWILADDILLMAFGPDMLASFANGMHATHLYIRAMGAKLAPSKSYNFASTLKARKWLATTRWPSIPGPVAILNDFRYLGAHISVTGKKTGRTIKDRFRKATAMLRKLASMPISIGNN